MAKKNTPPNDTPQGDNNDPLFIPFEEDHSDDFAEDQKLRKAFQEKQRAYQNRKQEPTYEPTEDEKEFDRDPLFETAMRLLPIDSPAVLTAIQKVSNIHFISLLSGGLAERIYRGENGMGDLTLDYMIAGFLLSGAENFEDLTNAFEEEVLYYAEELLQLNIKDIASDDIHEDRFDYAHTPKTARRMYTVQIVAQLSALETELKNEKQFNIDVNEFEKLADILIRESVTKPYENIDADEHLLNIGVDTFNQIAETIQSPTLLRISADGEITKHENLGPTNFYHPPKKPKP